MSDILQKRVAMQTSSTRDVNRYGISLSQPSTNSHREQLDTLLGHSRSDLMSADSILSSSTPTSDTVHSERTFQVATAKGGRKLMSEEEVNSLVHNALRRARQATTSASPRHWSRPDPLSPRMTTSSSGVSGPRPPAASPSGTSSVISTSEGRTAYGGSTSQSSQSKRSDPPGNSADRYHFSMPTIESNMSNMTNFSYDGSDINQTLTEEDSTSRYPMLSTVNSSEAIIRRVEEEIANARKAAQEANRRLAGVSANYRLSGLPSYMMTEDVVVSRQPTANYDLPHDPSDEINLPAKPQPSEGSVGPSVVRNDTDPGDSSDERSYSGFSTQGTDPSANMGSSPSIDNQVSIMTEDSMDNAEDLLDEVLNGSIENGQSEMTSAPTEEDIDIGVKEENGHEVSQLQLLHLESESMDKERYVLSPSYGRSMDEPGERQNFFPRDVDHSVTQKEQNYHTQPKVNAEFPSQLSAQGNIIMRLLAKADEKPRSDPQEKYQKQADKQGDGEDSCHEVIDLTAVESEGTHGPAKYAAQNHHSVEPTASTINYKGSTESSTTSNLEYEAPADSIDNSFSLGPEKRTQEQDFKLKYPILVVEPKRTCVETYDHGTYPLFQDNIEGKESLEVGASSSFQQGIEGKESIEVGASSSFHHSIEEDDTVELKADDSAEKSEYSDVKLKYPPLAVEPQLESGAYSQGSSMSFQDNIKEKEIIEVTAEYVASLSNENSVQEEDDDVEPTAESPESHDQNDAGTLDSCEAYGYHHIIELGNGSNYDEPIVVSIPADNVGEVEVVPSNSVEGDETVIVEMVNNEEDTTAESAAERVDIDDEEDSTPSPDPSPEALSSSHSLVGGDDITSELSPVEETVTSPTDNTTDDTVLVEVEETETIDTQSDEDAIESEAQHALEVSVVEEAEGEEVEDSNFDDATEIVANSSFPSDSQEKIEESSSEINATTADKSFPETEENIDNEEHVTVSEDAPNETSDQLLSSSLETVVERDPLVEEEKSKEDGELTKHQPPATASPTEQPGLFKISRSSKVRFKQRYPVPTSIKRPRSAELIVKDHSVPHSGTALFLSKPKPDLKELLQAVVGPSLQRRSNACGALKVLTTQKKNQLTLVRTAGFLDALVFAANEKISRHDVETAKDARARAVLAICNVSEPMDNREIVFKHPGLCAVLIKAMEEDKTEARTAACGAIAMLAKTPSNREPMAQTEGLLNALAMVLDGGTSRGDIDKSSYSIDEEEESFQQSYSSDSESSSSSLDNGSSMSHDDVETRLPRVRSMRQQKEGQLGETVRRGQLNACAALLHISKQCGATPVMSSNVDLMDALVDVSQREDDPKHTKSLEILCNLTRFPANTEPMATHPGLVDTLVVNGGSSNQLDRVWSLRILQNLSSDVTGKTVLANRTVLELLSYSVMRDSLEEQLAATATLYNLSTEPGAVVPLTNTKNVVATLVHVAHNPESVSEVRILACNALATLGLWMQTLAGAGTVPKEVDENVTLPSYITSGWERWD